jgi:hypothetical protein
MTTAELCIVAIAAVGLAVWLRGCYRRLWGDLLLGLLIGVVSCVVYFFVFSLTHIAYLAAMILGVFLITLLVFRQMRRTQAGKIFVGVCLVLVAAAGVTEYKLMSLGNAMLVIEPYRAGNQWRFDEPLLHLKAEPFVRGIPEMIDKMSANIPGSDKRVRLIFSQNPFPGYEYRLDRLREEDGGNWYYSDAYQMQGWLCPALFKFFPRAPSHIYVRAEEAS